MGHGDQLFGDMFHQSFFGGERVARVGGEADALGDAEHMSVDGHGGTVPHYGKHHVGGLAAYAGDAHEVVDIVGNLAVELLDYGACGADERAGFVVGV